MEPCFTRCLCVLKLHFLSSKLSERMKIVDVVGARVFKDGERLITQVRCWDTRRWVFSLRETTTAQNVTSVSAAFCACKGEEADCFYVVESGEVKIMITSQVSASDNASASNASCLSPLMCAGLTGSFVSVAGEGGPAGRGGGGSLL